MSYENGSAHDRYQNSFRLLRISSSTLRRYPMLSILSVAAASLLAFASAVSGAILATARR
jgi:hypothetical protein